MGGRAFSSAAARGEPTLHTPRMSPENYHRLKQTYLARLQDCFPGCNVSCLAEAPDKADYGDIDIKICSTETNVDFIAIANRVGAAGIICLSAKGRQNCTIGVPMDGSASPGPVVIYQPVQTRSSTAVRRLPARLTTSSTNKDCACPPAPMTAEAYAQIDLEVLPPASAPWKMFVLSYGDLSSILGRMTWPLGFTINDRGLMLRLRELDASKANPHHIVADAEGLLLLSDDPARVMRFWGLSPERYEAGFASMDGFYEWLAECRGLDRDVVAVRRVNASERSRVHMRSAYVAFFDEWLPSRLGIEVADAEGAGPEGVAEKFRAERAARLDVRRERLLAEAVDFFDKREEYESLHEALLRKIRNQTANQLVKELVALHSGKTEKKLSEAVRPFRRWVGVRAGKLCILDAPHSDEESQLHLLLDEGGRCLKDIEMTSLWVREHWEELLGLSRHSSA